MALSVPMPAVEVDDARAVSPARPGFVSRRALFERLEEAGRVAEVSAPAGSGKTLLLRSWISERGLADTTAWVSVRPHERDGQRFWLSVVEALGHTTPGSTLVRELTAAAALNTGETFERLLEDVNALDEPLWLVIDDLHELHCPEALRQLETLVIRAPDALRFVLATRHDLRLGLHRLRLDGGLTEIRDRDLRFTRDQAQELSATAGVQLSGTALALLHDRTEGWAAGLRLAALSLVGHPDPERFAADFSGTEHTVAEYLQAEVLERQPPEVRRLLLRTSVLERVSGPLAEHLTGDSGAEGILHQLERTNAFVISLDGRRSWFRYHKLFADVLALELRRTDPREIPVLHNAAAQWFADHDHPVEAVRHAQAAHNWSLAAGLLVDCWLRVALDGRAANVHELLCGFPDQVASDTPELIALAAADELHRGSLTEAQARLAQAEREASSVPIERRGRFRVLLDIVALCLARQHGDLPTVAVQARRLLAPVPAAAAAVAEPGKTEEWRALALISLGIAETYSGAGDDADHHLEQGIALARQAQRPYLELLGLAHGARDAALRSYGLGARRARQAIALAEQHGWSEEPLAGVAYASLAGAAVAQGRLHEAERWLERAGRALRPELEPAAGITLQWSRGMLALARGRPDQALDAFQAAESLAGLLRTPHSDIATVRAQKLQTLVRLGHPELVEAALAAMDEHERGTVPMRTAAAALRLAGDDPEAASAALAPALDGSARASHPICLVEALLQEAAARAMLGDAGASKRAIERALDLAEPDGILLPFLLHPVRELLERHSRHQTSHAALVAELLNLVAGRPASPVVDEPERLRDPLSESETRILRYLPTNLSLREIGNELYVSVHTVKTHIRHLYGKLDVHTRADAVTRARTLGLLAPSSRAPRAQPQQRDQSTPAVAVGDRYQITSSG